MNLKITKVFIVRDKAQKEAFRNAMFVNKSMNKDAVGQSVHTIAKLQVLKYQRIQNNSNRS